MTDHRWRVTGYNRYDADAQILVSAAMREAVPDAVVDAVHSVVGMTHSRVEVAAALAPWTGWVIDDLGSEPEQA